MLHVDGQIFKNNQWSVLCWADCFLVLIKVMMKAREEEGIQDVKVIDPSTVFFFSTFDKDQLANTHQHYWKERLQISKLAKLESDMSEVSEDIASAQSRKLLQTFVCMVECTKSYKRLTYRFQTLQVNYHLRYSFVRLLVVLFFWLKNVNLHITLIF